MGPLGGTVGFLEDPSLLLVCVGTDWSGEGVPAGPRDYTPVWGVTWPDPITLAHEQPFYPSLRF